VASFNEIAKKINKAWKDEVLVSGNFVKEVERIPLGDLGADYALFGGIPEGCLTVFSGVEHSGKTLSAALAMAQYQKKYPNKVNVWVDAENTIPVQADFLHRMTGLDVFSETFFRYDCSGKAAEEIFADIIQLEDADNIGFICLDSAPALISKADLDNEFEKDNGQRASVAKSLGKFIKQMLMLLPKKENVLLIINQVREDGKNYMGATIYKEPCGYALGYYPSMKVRFGTRNFTLDEKTDLAASKSEGADGFRLKFSVTKSRLGPTNRGGGFLTFRYDTGLDYMFDTLEVALKFGYIRRPNNQTYILINLSTGEVYKDEETGGELKFLGKQKLIDYLNSHPDFKMSYFNMLNENISASKEKVNLLDKDSMNEILKQEAEVSNQKYEPDTDTEEDK